MNATGLKRWHIARTLSRLHQRNMITITQTGNSYQSVSYGFQKDYSLWKPLPKMVTVAQPLPLQGKPLPKQVTEPLPKQVITKDNKEKQNIYTTTGSKIIYETRGSVMEDPWYNKDFKLLFPAFEDSELVAAFAWLTDNPKRKCSRRFLVNWARRIKSSTDMQREELGGMSGNTGATSGEMEGAFPGGTGQDTRIKRPGQRAGSGRGAPFIPGKSIPEW